MGLLRSKQAAMHPHLLVLLSLLLARPLVSATSLAYCASSNTGSSFSPVSNIFQSNGACEQTCKEYAFGILLGKQCWCSNVAPASGSTTSDSECAIPCPGYPKDSCGNAAKGVYAYVSIPGNSPTSTAAGSSTPMTTSSSSSTTSTTSTGSTSGAPSTETVTVTASQSSSHAPQTPSSTSSSDSSTTTGSATVTTTSGGVVKTITVPATTATGTSDASPTNTSGSSSGSSGLSGGSIAGIVVGVIGGLALIGALIFLVFFYRRRAERASSPVLSQGMTERNSRGSSFMRGVFPHSHGQDVAGASNGLGRQQTFTDNRLRTDTVLYANGDRDSSVSLQDNEDYSRPVLRLTNPD